MRFLEPERLLLRRLTIEDSKVMLELLNGPSWLKFIGDKGVRTLDETQDYVQILRQISARDRVQIALWAKQPLLG